ncbi:MAG TPA: hypothetical protein PKW20_09480, partial [Syntrophales bacterium]|nr:hypothetical protein [Syntrophales bacterium]
MVHSIQADKDRGQGKPLSYHDYPREPVVVDNLSVKFMKQSRFVPLKLEENTVRIAMADPSDFSTVEAL